jgi:septal ring factor EnvC (AmiA/AmiB activator)
LSLLRAAFFALVAGWLAASAGSALAAPSLDSKKGELDEVRDRLQTLRKNLSKDEASHNQTADQLRDTETAISGATRKLRELTDSRREVEAERAQFDSQRVQLERNTAAQQQQLALLLKRQFVSGSNDSDTLRLIIGGRDPNQTARDSYFLTRLSVAKAELIKQLGGVAREKQRLANAAEQRAERLQAIEAEQAAARQQLLKEQQKRQSLLKQLATRVKTQRTEISVLQRDEQRMSKLIDGLVKLAAERSRQREKGEKKQAATKVGAGGTAHTAPVGPMAAKPTLATSSRKIANAEPGKVSGTFGSLRGRLPLPVGGQISGRFGAARPDADGNLRWKGLFIRATEGVDVHAIAAGTVVFAEWLRGFGNLVIVDHDDDFLSVYANNQSLLRAAGDEVKAGQTVATVGNSGGIAQSGLYFELRHRGQAFDPAPWLKR